ncbi:Uncharacterised protein [Mycobacterium tuberculosis]|nr:Uncharacterised protein [Mycobacterium tuberculosis]COW57835.1 Uncharacterised protein [Mycobacterium tuberculosis]
MGRGGGHHAGIGNRCQVDETQTIAKFRRGRDLDRQTRLTYTALAAQRHQPVVRQDLLHLVDLCVTAYKSGELGRKAGSVTDRHPQRRKLIA